MQLIRESLTIRQSLADKCLESLISVASTQSRAGLAARLFGCAEELRASLGAPLPPARRLWHEPVGAEIASGA